MNHKQAWCMTQGSLHPADSSAVKVFGSEFYVQGYNLLLEVMGAAGTLKTGSPAAVIQGRVEMRYLSSLILTFGGGTNEVQRDIIAMAGLQLPHYKS
jgi:alkylation response protein AidB-like acyl-CoA dehydrogenase